MDNALSNSLDQIWTGDLFGRRQDADMLAAYIESVWERPIVREDGRAYTIAVDAGYGEGKSFFLRRLAKHLATNHPVAFVDAWADDIADEPLTALAATLKKALSPLIKEPGVVQNRWRSVVEKTGKVAWIASKGLLRRGVSLAVTGGVLEAIDGVIEGATDAITDAVEDSIKDAGKELPGEVLDAAKLASPKGLMAGRIEEFEAGAAAIKDLKNSLSALVDALAATDSHPPIIIIIDELDRCRPTYSVKLLEEIKHLFDVPGLVFIFGMHGGQLAHSLAAAYGTHFDGAAYLRRFINRRYTLTTPDLSPLLKVLLKQAGLTDQQYPVPIISEGYKRAHTSLDDMISRYMKLFNLTARDAFGVVDILQTCSAIVSGNPLILCYIVPLALAYHMGKQPEYLTDIRDTDEWAIVTQEKDTSEGMSEEVVPPMQWMKHLRDVAKISKNQLIDNMNNNHAASRWIYEATEGKNIISVYNSPHRYPDLLRAVGRFKNPEIEALNEDKEESYRA